MAAADWMRAWGYQYVAAATGGPDGGVDVRSSTAVAQVKAKTKPTGRPEVQQLAGIAAHESVQGFFFSLSGFTDEAMAWGTDAEVALFGFDLQGVPQPLNRWANAVVQLWVPRPNPEHWKPIRKEILSSIRDVPRPESGSIHPDVIGDWAIAWVGTAPCLDAADLPNGGFAQFGVRRETLDRGNGYVPQAIFRSPRIDDLLPETQRFRRAIVQRRSRDDPVYVVGGQIPLENAGEIYLSFGSAEETADWVVEVAQTVGVDPTSWQTASDFSAGQAKLMADLGRRLKELPDVFTPEERQDYEDQKAARVREAIKAGIGSVEANGPEFSLGGLLVAERFHPNILERYLRISAGKKFRENLDEELAKLGVVKFIDQETWYEMEAEIEFPVPDGVLIDAERFERFHWVRPESWSELITPENWGVRSKQPDVESACDWVIEVLEALGVPAYSVRSSLDLD